MEIREHAAVWCLDMLADLQASAAATEEGDRDVQRFMDVAVFHAGAVEHNAVVQQRTIALRRSRFISAQKPRGLGREPLGNLVVAFDLFWIVAVMRVVVMIAF